MTELDDFIDEYGQYIRMYKKYDNGVVMMKFENKTQIMWLKRMIHEELNMRVKTSTPGKTYWFEPKEER